MPRDHYRQLCDASPSSAGWCTSLQELVHHNFSGILKIQMKPLKNHSLLTQNFRGDSLICLLTGNKSARIVINSISIMNVFLFKAKMPQIVWFQLLNNDICWLS